MNQADAYKEARKAVSLGAFHGGWSSKEKRRHINDSGLTGVKLALFASTGGGLLNPIHLQIKNTNPIS